MSDDRRYSDDEVARIFELAAKPDVSVRDTSGSEGTEGLTLAELQAIGREVGIAPEHIADAAMTLDAGASETPPHTDFGMEISVGRAVRLARAFTDREWAMLVSELRDTFRARGNEASSGDARQWFNGNLHARVEPTPTGYRFRVATLKGDAPALNRIAATGIVTGLVALVTLVSRGAPVGPAVVVGAMGAGAFAFNVVRLRRWSRERAEQMDYIVRRARALIGAGGGPAAE